MATIDELSIEVQSSAKKVDGTIEKVAEQLKSLENAVSGIDAGKMHSMSTAIRKIADASTGFRGNKSNEIRSLASALKSFDKVNTNSLYSESNAIEKLSDGMKGISGVSFNADGILNISNALNKLGNVKAIEGTKNLKKVKNDLIDFSNGLNGMGAVNFDASGLSSVISSVAKLGGKASTNATANLPKIKKDLIGFIQGLNGLQSLKFDTTGIANLTSSISKLGGKASTNAVKTIPQLTTALNGMMTVLSKAPKVSSNVIQMTQALAQLASQGGRAGTASNSLVRGLNNISAGAKKTHKNIFSLATSFGKFYAVFWGIKRAFSAFSGSIELASDLTEVQNVVDTTFGNMANKVEDFTKSSIQNFGMSELATKQYASQFQAMGTAMGINQNLIGNANKFLNEQTGGYVGLSNSMSDVSLNLTKLTADMASFYNVEQAAVAEDLQSIFTGQTRPLRAYGLDLTQATLAEWAMKQGLDADIQSMSQAEKTMLRYQYVLANTLASHNDFRDTAMTWANQTRILKQQFQQLGSVIGGTFINAFKPFVATLNAVLAKVISFAETVSNALGKIFGWTIEVSSGGLTNDIGADLSDAAGGADDLADGLGGANDSAKKLQKTLSLLPFDQLNQLTGNKDAGSNGSGGGGKGDGSGAGGAGGGGAMANLVKTDTIFDKYKSEIDTLYELGDYIGKTLTKAMNDIDWDKVYQGARNFGKGLADFLNGLISPELFGATGRTIAGALNTALHALDSFGETFNWKEFGLSIATGINEFFRTFDFKLFAKTINVWANGLLDTLITALDNTDWGMIGRQIGTFLAEIDFLKIAAKLGKALWKAINGAIKTYSSMFSKAPVETALASLLVIPKALKAIVDTKFAKGILDLSNKFKSLASTTKLAIGAFTGNATAIANLSGKFPKLSKAADVLGDSFQRLMFGAHYGDLKGGINAALSNIRDNLTEVQKGAIGAVGVFAEFSLMKSAFYDIASGADNLVASIGKIAAGAGVAVAALKLIDLPNPFTAVIVGATAAVSAIVGIGKAMNEIQAESAMEAVGNALKNPGGVPLEEITESYQNMVSGISASFDAINRKAEELETTKNHAKETSSSIDLIKFALENGSATAQEKIPELNELFNGLLADSKSIFEQEYDVIMLGISGSLGQSLIDAGYSIEQIVGMMDNLKTSHQKAIDDITKKNTDLKTSFDAGMISQEEYSAKFAENMKELAELSGQTDEYSVAIGKVSDAAGNVDLSKFINADNTLNAENLANEFGKMSDTANEAKDSIYASSDSLTSALKDFGTWSEKAGNSEATTVLSDALSLEADNVDLAVDSVDSALLQYSDTVQMGLLEKIPSVVDEALADYENQSWGYKFLHSEEEHVQAALDEYQTNVIDQASQKLEEMYSTMGIEGAVWGSDASKSIIDGLYNTTTTYSAEGAPIVTKTLNDNYRKIVTGATEGIREEAEKSGRYTIEGYNQGISENTSQSDTTVSKWQESIRNAIHNSSMKYGSPSKTAEGFGKDTVTGFNIGLTGNTASTVSIIRKWLSDIANSFSPYKSKFMEFGKSYMLNFKTGIESQRESVINSARTVINVLKNIFPAHTGDFRRYGSDYMKNLASGISGSSWDVTRAAQSVAGSIKSAFSNMSWDMYNNGRSAAQSFANGFSSVHIPTPHMYVSSWNTTNLGNGGRMSTPNFSVNWYKTGGLAYNPSVVGIGEAGPEAILPLENSKVMGMIADSITENGGGIDEDVLTNAIAQGFAMAMMANGGNRPPIHVDCYAELKTENNEVLARAVARGQESIDYRMNPTPQPAY